MLEPKGEKLVLPLFSQVKKQRFTEAVYLAHVTQHTRASLFSLHPLPVTQPASFPLLSRLLTYFAGGAPNEPLPSCLLRISFQAGHLVHFILCSITHSWLRTYTYVWSE